MYDKSFKEILACEWPSAEAQVGNISKTSSVGVTK